MAYPYYAPYNYQPYSAPRFEQQQFGPQNGPQGIVSPVFQQNNMNQPQPQPGFLCHPVTSREEALAVQVDYLSAGTLMPDLGHGMIYLKRFDANTGLSNMFEFAIIPQLKESAEAPAPNIPDYSELFRNFGEQLGSVSERIDALTDKLEMWKPKSASKKGVVEE